MNVGAPLLRERPRLIAVAVGGPVLEAAILWAVGLDSALGIAPQATAPAPFDVFHDLRWLLVYHRSWVGLGLEAIAFVLVRSVLTAVLVREAWPDDLDRPPLRRTLAHSALFVAAVAVLMSPW